MRALIDYHHADMIFCHTFLLGSKCILTPICEHQRYCRLSDKNRTAAEYITEHFALLRREQWREFLS